MHGFSELQIEQVVSNCEQIFSLEDVTRPVEIWDTCHAKKILDVLRSLFKDIATSNDNQAKDEINDDDELPDDNEVLGEWAVLAEDDELLNIMAKICSISEVDSTYQEIQQSMNCSDVNPAALESLQNVQIDLYINVANKNTGNVSRQ